ncbi:hypothetical protein AOLI_G00321580 [Acnodon oligacanthus]
MTRGRTKSAGQDDCRRRDAACLWFMAKAVWLDEAPRQDDSNTPCNVSASQPSAKALSDGSSFLQRFSSPTLKQPTSSQSP